MTVIARVDVGALRVSTKLIGDYMAAPNQGIPEHLPGVRGDRQFWADHGTPSATPSGMADSAWKQVVDEIARLSERMGTGRLELKKIRGAAERNTTLVVTGQQPGVMGGPLYTAYKIATAIALAEFIEARLKRPAVALYWCGADDTDFPEIRHFNLLTVDHSPVSAAIAQRAHRGGVPVGGISLEAIADVWRNVESFVGAFSAGANVRSVVDSAFSKARDFGELSCAMVTLLFGGRVGIVDGRSEAVRRCAAPLIQRYVQEEEDIKRVVRNTGADLEAKGYHAQITPGPDSGVFLLDRGVRKVVSASEHGALVEASRHEVERCSPGVVLRNLVQDYTLRPAAVVLGPGELAYRAQIGSLYTRFDVPRPVDFLRLGATFLTPQLAEVLGATGCADAAQLLSDPAACARAVYKKETPSGVVAAAAELEAALVESVDRFLERAGKLSSTRLRQRIEKRAGEVRSVAHALAAAAMDAGREGALEKWPFLGRIGQLVRPNDKPQERWLSSLSPFLYDGEAAGGHLVDIARAYAVDLMDGHARHVVYSTLSTRSKHEDTGLRHSS